MSPHVSPEVEDWQESRWPPLIAIFVAGGLYAVLPSNFVPGGSWVEWVIPSLELVLLIVAAAAPPRNESNLLRTAGMALAVLITIANASSLAMLVADIAGEQGLAGRDLTWAAIDLWVTNAIIFGVWYWELDGGGPRVRAEQPARYHEFLFAQYQLPEPWTWRPQFLDYLFLAFTNSASFAPADTMPLSTRAKALMAAQSVISLGIILIVAARAISILH